MITVLLVILGGVLALLGLALQSIMACADMMLGIGGAALRGYLGDRLPSDRNKRPFRYHLIQPYAWAYLGSIVCLVYATLRLTGVV